MQAIKCSSMPKMVARDITNNIIAKFITENILYLTKLAGLANTLS